MQFEITKDVQTEDITITIRIPRRYILCGERARFNVSDRIDMEQFFGMLEDVICMKLGLEPPKSRNVSECVSFVTDSGRKSF